MTHTKPRDPQTDHFTVTLGERGRVVLPAQVRQRLDLSEGDRLVLSVLPDGTLQLVSLKAQVRKFKGIYKDSAQGRSIVDELIAERREEARREGAP